MNIIAYIFGILALLIWLYSVQVKEKKNILLLQSLANFSYAIQYFIFNLVSTGLMNMISVVRGIVFAKSIEKRREPNIFYLVFFILIILVLGLAYYREPLDIIPIIATIFYTISGWVKKDVVLRYTYILCACIFCFYNYQVGAYIPLIGNIGEVVSGTISIIRFNKK